MQNKVGWPTFGGLFEIYGETSCSFWIIDIKGLLLLLLFSSTWHHRHLRMHGRKERKAGGVILFAVPFQMVLLTKAVTVLVMCPPGQPRGAHTPTYNTHMTSRHVDHGERAVETLRFHRERERYRYFCPIMYTGVLYVNTGDVFPVIDI
jgi:hypothetical protein